MIFDKSAKITQWGKNSLLNKWCLENSILTCINEIGSLPHTIHKINSKCIKDLNLSDKTMELFEENMTEKASGHWT